jgi:hypothetical protein
MNEQDNLNENAADPTADPSLWQGYEEWMREREQCEEWNDLQEWARLTLACAPLPCACLRTLRCLRCRVAALVEPRAGERCPRCGAPLLSCEGESYCTDCTRFEPAA